MAKEKRGLPQGFGLNVAKPTEEPVRWGDYVDEEMAPRVAREAAPDAQKVVPMVQPAERAPARVEDDEDDDTPAPPSARQLADEDARSERLQRFRRREPAPKPVKQVQRPLRVQLNMTPDTQRMLELLLDDVRTYSSEKHATAADICEALVLAAYEAREEHDFSRIRPRGRWGTPTAAAFRVALKTAFQRGTAGHVQKVG